MRGRKYDLQYSLFVNSFIGHYFRSIYQSNCSIFHRRLCKYVIHLVEGEIPSISSIAKKPPSEANPWDVPGTPISNCIASDQLSTSSLRWSEEIQVDDGTHLCSSSNDDSAHLWSFKILVSFIVNSIQFSCFSST